jgi:hypothetical protein
LIDFARQIAGIPQSALEVEYNSIQSTPGSEASALAPPNDSNTIPDNPPLISKKQDAVPTALQNTQPAQAIEPRTSGGKQLRIPDEIAKMIMATLQAIDSCPERGFVVTVYGSNPWNAMLTIKPEAGPKIDHHLWRSRVQEIGVRLRDDFDIIQETTAFTDSVRHEVTESD